MMPASGPQALKPSRPQSLKASPPQMSYWQASRRVFDLSLGEMLWSRRTIFMALVVAGPVVLALIVRGVEMFGMSALRINGQRVAGFGIFGVMIWMLFGIVYVLSAVAGLLCRSGGGW